MSEWKDIKAEVEAFGWVPAVGPKHVLDMHTEDLTAFARRCIANGVRDAAAELEQLQHPEAAKAMWEFADRIERGEVDV